MYRYGLGAGDLPPYFLSASFDSCAWFQNIVYFGVRVLEQITMTAQVIYLDVFLYKVYCVQHKHVNGRI